MRLHRLRVQAFGPFAGVEEVDVDVLCASGLFLLHGPTGAGKTSVLDAVCFALYGRVPGARAAGAPRLRSDHAAPGVPPEVVCDFSVAGRRFEVTRSPAWERRKKRGSGTTTEQARTVLRERVDGEWVPRSARNDEAAQLLTEVLGMGLEQFTKVVLLPQGEFAAFLRCGAEERRPLLERLFGTDRFSEVERWLADERRRLAQRVDDVDATLTRLVAQAHQSVAGLPVPGDLVHDRGAMADVGSHLDALLSAVRRVLSMCREDRDAAARDRAEVMRQRDAVARRLENLRRLTVALAEQRELEARAPEARAWAAELAAGRRAETVAGHLRALADARAAERTAVEAVRDARRGLGQDAPGDVEVDAEVDVEVDALRGWARDARDEVARLAELADAEIELDGLAAAARVQQEDVRGLHAALGSHDEAAERRARRQANLREEVALVAGTAADVAAAEAALDQARAVLEAARSASEVAEEVASAERVVARARDDALAARGRWLDLRERRLDGMAAELAASLQDGEPCPVCGSADHPLPAPPSGTGVSAEAEAEARTASETADAHRTAAEAALASRREAHVAHLAASSGLRPGEAAARWETARKRLAEGERAAAALAAAEDELAALAAADVCAASARSSLVDELAAARAAAEAADREVQGLRQRLDGARGDDVSVTTRRDRLARHAAALDALVDARVGRAHAESVRERTAEAAAAACRDAGFADVATAERASLAPAELVDLQTRVDAHGERDAVLRARLREPEMLAAAEDLGALEDLAQRSGRLEQAVRDAEGHLEAATGAQALAERAAASLEDLRAHAAVETAASEPLRRQYAVVADLAHCANATGGDNLLRMRLSAYVLAARLEQVAEAATVRLAGMSAGRYALVHSDAAERRGARSGLGLRVVDGWTGLERDTCTLSGGESFLASLALALGLADVVQAESGGSAIETLFVDEGFGSLDDETLEEVMGILDGLREGGRAVGLVSHVAELRNRIPTRLEVVKTRTGSHFRTEGPGSPTAAGAA